MSIQKFFISILVCLQIVGAPLTLMAGQTAGNTGDQNGQRTVTEIKLPKLENLPIPSQVDQKARILEMYKQAKLRPEKIKLIDSSYITLNFAMFMSQLFAAMQSGDPLLVKEFLHQVAGPEFHLNMMLFTAGMRGWQEAVIFSDMLLHYGADHELIYQTLMSWTLPIGDLVSSYFADIYKNPTLLSIVKAYSPTAEVIDPAHPDKGKTNSPSGRERFRKQMEVRLMEDIWKNISFSNGQGTFSKWFHAVNLATVQVTFHGVRTKVVTFVERKTIGAAEDRFTLALARFSPEIQEYFLLNPAEAPVEARLIKAFKLAEYVKNFSSLGWVRGLAGITDLTLLFIATNVAVDVALPYFENTFAQTDVFKSEDQLQTTVNWYLDPKRTEELPWAYLKSDSADYKWLKFFANGANFNDKTFLNDTSWHGYQESNNYPMSPIWRQAFSFMARFSAKYLGKFVDDVSYYGCQGKYFTWYTIPTDIGYDCKKEWVQKNAPLFVNDLKNFKAVQMIKSRLDHLDDQFTRYRNEVILKDVYATWGRWTKEVTEEESNQAKREAYFIWISRGMHEDDPFFVENKMLWHISAEDPRNLRPEEEKFVMAYDREVLRDENACENPEPHTLSCPSMALSFHQAAMERYVKENRGLVDKSNIMAPLIYLYPNGFDETVDPHSAEVAQVKSEYIENPFALKNPETGVDQDKLGLIARWLASGFDTSTKAFQDNKKVWHPEEFTAKTAPAYVANMITDLIVQPLIYTSVPKNVSPENAQKIMQAKMQLQMAEMFSVLTSGPKDPLDEILKGRTLDFSKNPPQLTNETRDFLTLAAPTYGYLVRERTELLEKIRVLNSKYSGHLKFAASPGDVRNSSWYGKILAYFNHGKPYFNGADTVFNRGGNEDRHLPGLSIDNFWRSLPRGTVNLSNREIADLAHIESTLLAQAHVDETYKDDNADVISFKQKAVTILGRLGVFTGFLEQAIGNTDQPAQHPMLESASVFTLQVKSLVENMLNGGQIILDPAVKEQAAGAIQDITSRLARATSTAWPTLALTTEQYDVPTMYSQIAHVRNSAFDQLRGNLNQVEQLISKHSVGYATEDDDLKLEHMLANENFGIPLMAATTGASGRNLEVAEAIGAQIINVQNQKTIQARMGCYLIHDQLCASLEH